MKRFYGENKGKVMENEVAVELQRRKSKERQLEVYYWKDHQQREVDFVIKKGKTVGQLLQVSAITAKEDIREREIKALLKAREELRCKNLAVITWDYEAQERRGGEMIAFIPLWKWLLG